MSNIKPSAAGDRMIQEIVDDCVLTRTRVISRVLTGIYDDAYRPFGVTSSQLILLTIICKMKQASRAAIARYNHQERSTMTRNLQIMLTEGWIEEVAHDGKGRARPIGVTAKGLQLLHDTRPAWRAAQKQATAVLGKSGAAAIMEIGNVMMTP